MTKRAMPVRQRRNAEIEVVVGGMERAEKFVEAFCPSATGRTIWWRHELKSEGGYLWGRKAKRRIKIKLFIIRYEVRNNTDYDLMRFVTEAAKRSGVQIFSAELVERGMITDV